MASLTAILILIITFFGTNYATESLNFPTQYHFKGEKIYVTAGVVQPFEIWYLESSKRSRMDVFGGTVNNFYKWSQLWLTTYMIHSETDKELNNKKECFSYYKLHETEDSKKEYKFLPSTEDFSYEGKTEFGNKNVSVWKKQTAENGVKRETTFYTYRTVEGVDVPVRSEIKSFYEWTQGLANEIISNYYDYQAAVNRSILDLKSIKSMDKHSCIKVAVAHDTRKDVNIAHFDEQVNTDAAFNHFKILHDKAYDETEHQFRRAVFENNLKHIIHHNRQNLSYKLEANGFADRSDEEFESMSCLRAFHSETSDAHPFPYSLEEVETIVQEIPSDYDQRIEGLIGPVKNQANCGSCWAFTVTAAVEGALAKKNGGIIRDLSEQSLVDCAWGFDNYGCDGGNLMNAMRYVYAHGIPTEQEYGLYMMTDGICHLQNSGTNKIEGFALVPPRNENAFKVALFKHGPVAVAIHASKNMYLYSNGIFFDLECKDQTPNHAVTVVGYGVRRDTTYWIVKNSWGAAWGQDGYVLLSATENNCYLQDNGYFVIG